MHVRYKAFSQQSPKGLLGASNLTQRTLHAAVAAYVGTGARNYEARMTTPASTDRANRCAKAHPDKYSDHRGTAFPNVRQHHVKRLNEAD
jgi:hypothetical protein